MRPLVFLVNIGIVALAFYLGSWTGLLIAAAVCIALVAGFFVFSTAKTEARESSEMRRAMGRNTTLIGGLFQPKR